MIKTVKNFRYYIKDRWKMRKLQVNVWKNHSVEAIYLTDLSLGSS